MEAKELRIGNLVFREDLGDGHKRVEEILEISNKLVCSGPLRVICEYNDVKPIPLTEECLIKFGFKYNEEDQAFINGFLHIEDRDNDRYIPEKTREKLKGCFGVWFDDSPSFITDIKHVHQLQNLYFALTGEELKCI